MGRYVLLVILGTTFIICGFISHIVFLWSGALMAAGRYERGQFACFEALFFLIGLAILFSQIRAMSEGAIISSRASFLLWLGLVLALVLACYTILVALPS